MSAVCVMVQRQCRMVVNHTTTQTIKSNTRKKIFVCKKKKDSSIPKRQDLIDAFVKNPLNNRSSFPKEAEKDRNVI